ncbi:MAG: peptide ABC transporter substrate-binding protein [Woeseiaceae bacterium]
MYRMAGINQRRSLTAVLSISLLISTGLASCSDTIPTDENTLQTSTVLSRATTSKPLTLDPHQSVDHTTDEVLRDLFEGLIAEDRTGSLTPGVASQWSRSDDGMTYEFQLRTDARWSNGEPLTAEDFVNSFRRAVAPDTNSPMASVFFSMENAESISDGKAPLHALGVIAIDQHTLRIRLSQPSSYFLKTLTTTVAFPVFNAGKVGASNNNKPIIGNGPYKFQQQAEADRTSLIKNTHYWNHESVYFDRVDYVVVPDDEAALAQYANGDIDLTNHLSATDYPRLRRQFGDELKVAPTFGIYTLAFDTTEPPFNDVRLRQALSMAIDRDVLATEVMADSSPGAWSFLPPGINEGHNFTYSWRSLGRKEQREIARALYREVGFSKQNPLKLKITFAKSGNYGAITSAVKQMLSRNLGVDVTLESSSWAKLIATRDKFDQWDLIRFGVGGIYEDPNTFLEIMRSGANRNPAGWRDTTFDQLLDDANRELDPLRRAERLHTAESHLMEAYPIIPLHFLVSIRLINPRIEGFSISLMNRTYTKHLAAKAETGWPSNN